jgi:acetyltransferase-like isoleucine patch superfamily enzyme
LLFGDTIQGITQSPNSTQVQFTKNGVREFDCVIGADGLHSNVRAGAGLICPGVKIGSKSVIGAGSIVTRDIPDRVFAAGNPCRVIEEITDDRLVHPEASQRAHVD